MRALAAMDAQLKSSSAVAGVHHCSADSGVRATLGEEGRGALSVGVIVLVSLSGSQVCSFPSAAADVWRR